MQCRYCPKCDELLMPDEDVLCGKIELLMEGYRRIAAATDLESRDGDLAREIAQSMLTPNTVK